MFHRASIPPQVAVIHGATASDKRLEPLETFLPRETDLRKIMTQQNVVPSSRVPCPTRIVVLLTTEAGGV